MYTKVICLICFNGRLFTNQVTNVLTEVVPFCKSGHNYLYFSINIRNITYYCILGMSTLTNDRYIIIIL